MMLGGGLNADRLLKFLERCGKLLQLQQRRPQVVMRGRSIRIKFNRNVQLARRILLLAGEQKQLPQGTVLARVAGILRHRQLQFRDRRRVFVFRHVSAGQ